MACDLCDAPGGRLLWQDDRVRVVYVDEPGFAGYCRVVWQQHVAEMTDLDEASRAYCMRVVFTVESLLRERINPDKVNLASLGNLTPHVHWHVIARFRDDSHFPQAIWGARQRDLRVREAADLPDNLAKDLKAHLGATRQRPEIRGSYVAPADPNLY